MLKWHIRDRWIISLAVAFVLSLPNLSCRSHKDATTHTYRPYHERRNRGKQSSSQTKANQRKTEAKTSHQGLVSDQWARLDVALSHRDNKLLYQVLRRWLGTPYCYAAHECGVGADCSGMVMEVFLEVYDIKLERNTAKMLEENCKVIDRDDLREGDLVFFVTSHSGRVSHVGIYLKEDKFVHASSTRGVVVDDLRQDYYASHFYTAARVVS